MNRRWFAVARSLFLLIQEAAHFAAARWMFQFAQRFCFDLTNTLA